MEMILARCGLDCAQCPAFIASKNNDTELRVKTAKEWSTMFNFAFTPEMINCHGCNATDGVQIGHCSQCNIRACAAERNVEHCGACSDFGCTQLTEFFTHAPEAEKNLKALR